MKISPEHRKLVKKARAQGWTLEQRKSGHNRLTSPDGQRYITFAATASDHRAWKAFRADLRHAGVDV